MYIGYATLEQLLAHVNSECTLHLILLEEYLPGADGIDLFRCELLAQVSIQNGQASGVRYWRMRIGQAIAPGGEPWPQELQKIRKSGASALESIKQFLASQPHVQQIEEGSVIAMPRNLKLLAGCARCLQFDHASGAYRLKENEALVRSRPKAEV